MTLPPSQDPGLAATDLQAILDSSSDCIKVLDLDAHLLSMNAGGMAVMEIEDFSVCEHALWPTFWEGVAREQVEHALEAARAGHTTTFEGPAQTFAGTPKWWEVRVSPLRDPDGGITRLLAISRDITARKVAEQQLQEIQQLLSDRAQTLEVRVSQQERALDAFVRFTTQVASITDLEELAMAAGDIIKDAVGGATSGLYLIRGQTAFPLAFSRNTPPAVRVARQTGVPLSMPLAAEAVQARRTVFAQGEDGRVQSVGYASALSITPYFSGQRPYALFAAGTGRPEWTAQEQAIIESVGRGLGLALERAEQTRQLQERTASLDAFVAFTEAAGVAVDGLVLARQAELVLRATLDQVSVAVYELEDGLWKARIWSGDIQPEVIAAIQQGIPQDAPNFAEAAQSGTGVFVDGWKAEDDLAPSASNYGAVAIIPTQGGPTPQLFTVGTLAARAWTPREQAIIRAVGGALTLALKRTELARQLLLQRDALDRRTQELMAANEELEAFTYSASHDLRTPVRHVMGFADLARRALDQQQPEKVVRSLGIIQQGAARMEQLIDGMLMLSRAGRQDYHPRMVALEPLLTQAQRDAELDFPAQTIEVTLPTPVMVWGDATLLQQVMTNLINNAVKYSSGRDVSEVTVHVSDTDAEWVITVQDNGVGFDPRYAGKLFGIFQRLHTHDAFPGIGVGLATVRRIVLKHGGRVFADSVDGQGATFGVALPKPPEA
ncbi:ATP-binding protein [Deinococcus sp. KSM4-11]|uniref:ATP-binding protein n=1 Tax=Deinococcus sp. KSM4-11 TaxID=2568654 RepID=UPI001454B9D0|nr:ATP-binding protein [Deinococcus sp. KSM4-11]